MSDKENEKFDDELLDTSRVIPNKIPSGVDRRSFLMRSAVVGSYFYLAR